MIRFYPLLIFLFFLLMPSPCRAESAPLQVIVSIAPQKYILERIAGNALSVTVLVRPGDDPHSYEPSPSQMRAVSAAACWFSIGVPFEDAWLARIKGVAPDLAEYSMLEGIQRLPWGQEEGEDSGHVHGPECGHTHGSEDPHVWLSPMLVREITSHATRKLCRLLPEKAPEFRRNARAFMEELETLDQKLALRFKDFAKDRRVFLTFHPSWRYFAHNYELTELSIEVDGKEPGPKTLERIMGAARSHGIRTVFVEPQFPKSAATAIAEALDATIVEIDPLAENLVELYTTVADKLLSSFQRMDAPE